MSSLIILLLVGIYSSHAQWLYDTCEPTLRTKTVVGKSFHTKDTWIYLDQFCYDIDSINTFGVFNVTIFHNMPQLFLVVYLGIKDMTANDNWDYVWPNRNNLTCQQKVTLNRAIREVINGIPLTIKLLQLEKPYEWYFVLASCGSEIGIVLDSYEIAFSQTPQQPDVHDQGISPTPKKMTGDGVL